MKNIKRVFAIALSCALLLVSIPFSMVLAANGDGVLYEFEAEDSAGINTGTVIDDCIVAIKGAGANHIIYGNAFQDEDDPKKIVLPEGDYQVVIYAMLLDKTGYGNTKVANFDIDGRSSSGAAISISSKDLTEDMFPEINRYYAVATPVTISKALSYADVRVYFNDVCGMKFDKVVILESGATPEEPRQEDPDDTKPPEGTPIHESYTVPITQDALKLSDERAANIVDGRLEFRKTENVTGDVEGLTERFYLTGGAKNAQFYVRTPSNVSGQYGFFKVTVISGGIPVADERISGDFFTGNANQSILLEYPFIADPDKPIDVRIKWYGNHDIVVDKIVFSAESGSGAVDKEVTPDENGVVSFTQESLDEVSSIDSFAIKMGNNLVKMPVAYLIEWFEAGYTSVDVTVKNEDNTELKELVTSYPAKTNLLECISVHVTLKSAEETVELDQLSGNISIQTTLPKYITSSFGTGRKIPLGYQEDTEGNITMIGGSLEKPYRIVINTSIQKMGTIALGVADLS